MTDENDVIYALSHVGPVLLLGAVNMCVFQLADTLYKLFYARIY